MHLSHVPSGLIFRSVTIEKCRNTTIVLGPVETVVHMSHCEAVRLIACSRLVTVRYTSLVQS